MERIGSIDSPADFTSSEKEIPLHIRERDEREAELQELLLEENNRIDEIVKNFRATGDEMEDVKELYALLRLPANGRLGTMTAEKTRAFYAGALRLRSKELEDLAVEAKGEYDMDKFNALDTLADYFQMPIKLAELQERERRDAA